MGGVQRKWSRAERYARKGRTVGNVHDMTYEEREALCKGVSRPASEEDARVARIMAIRARRSNAQQEAS